MGEWKYSSTILELGTRLRCVVSFTARPLYPRGKSLRYPLERRFRGPPRADLVKMIISWLCRESNPRPSSPSLYRLSYPGSSPKCQKANSKSRLATDQQVHADMSYPSLQEDVCVCRDEHSCCWLVRIHLKERFYLDELRPISNCRQQNVCSAGK
jgi:hypothetical protein